MCRRACKQSRRLVLKDRCEHATIRHDRPLAWAFLVVVLSVACNDAGNNDGNSEQTPPDLHNQDVFDVENDNTAQQTICSLSLGEPCFEDEQCETGLCLISEFAPFGVCTVPCQTAPDVCISVDGVEYPNAWCVELPEDQFILLNHPDTNRFCVRTCATVEDCTDIHPAYETCDEIKYKGNPIYPSDPKSVCQAPSATGKNPVNPFTCAEWQTKNPNFSSERKLCTDYCAYLSACNYIEDGHNLDCCAWYCYLQMVDNNKVDEQYKDLLNNYVKVFLSAPGTAIQCTQGEVQFGPPSAPDKNAPKSVAELCAE